MTRTRCVVIVVAKETEPRVAPRGATPAGAPAGRCGRSSSLKPWAPPAARRRPRRGQRCGSAAAPRVRPAATGAPAALSGAAGSAGQVARDRRRRGPRPRGCRCSAGGHSRNAAETSKRGRRRCTGCRRPWSVARGGGTGENWDPLRRRFPRVRSASHCVGQATARRSRAGGPWAPAPAG